MLLLVAELLAPAVLPAPPELLAPAVPLPVPEPGLNGGMPASNELPTLLFPDPHAKAVRSSAEEHATRLSFGPRVASGGW